MALRGINKHTIIGNIGQAPNIRYTAQQQAVAVFQVATGEYWKEKGTGKPKEKTDWHNVVVFNHTLAEVIRDRAKAGTKVYIEGKSVTRKWKDDNGIEHSITELVVEGFHGIVQLLSPNEEEG